MLQTGAITRRAMMIQRNDQGRLGTYNFVVPGLSEPLF